MCTKYTASYYFNFCVTYTSSVNFITFPIVCCTSFSSFIGNLCLSMKLQNFKVQKVVKFYVHISPILMPGYICIHACM